MRCRLCHTDAEPFFVGATPYADCPVCGYVQIDDDHIPGEQAELARYTLHRNSYDDVGYTAWIASYLEKIVPFIPAGGTILDFGSGPEPVPGRLLSERGYRVCIYDPFFAPGASWRSGSWNAILMHEVAEHLADPYAILSELHPLLAPGGALCIRTRFAPRARKDFDRWWYRMDSTHVGFFREATMQWIAERWRLEPLLMEAPDSVVMRRPLLPAGS
jgi:SAM-dependent methyltransferase